MVRKVEDGNVEEDKFLSYGMFLYMHMLIGNRGFLVDGIVQMSKADKIRYRDAAFALADLIEGK